MVHIPKPAYNIEELAALKLVALDYNGQGATDRKSGAVCENPLRSQILTKVF